ncbi:MAG: hypothetical protein QOE70_2915 [Chthoniobacter sp.]|jgi:acetylornithine deacetylase/succinyl-diaminopimelate desuccinylase-like protein|nr:hypothetical protein [Chthoniobacter sp.]
MNDRSIDEYFRFLRFPSISTEPEHAGDVAACAAWLAEKLTAIGLQAEVHPTARHPLVIARNEHRSDRRTVLIYGHYDVQPVDPLELWTTPPFEPRLENGLVFARGATDNKGQIFSHILGVEEALQDGGELPVNLIFLIEGEEEIGSANLETFLLGHREELRCDIIAISDTGMIAPGVPTFTYGLRGIAALQVRVTGPATDLHSGIYGGAVANPAAVLARLIASLHDSEGRVAVPGFYDGIPPLEQWEREAWSRLPLTDAEILLITGAPALVGEAGFTTLERVWARPTLEVNGLWSGFQGPGSKTIIPREANVKLTFRLVPQQQPAVVVERVKAHLVSQTPPGVTVTFEGGHGAEPYVTDPHSAFGQAAQRALQTALPGKEVALVREGGSIPIVNTFKKVLGVETLLLGLALPDCHMHAPNETFPLENLAAGIRLNRTLLAELAAAN